MIWSFNSISFWFFYFQLQKNWNASQVEMKYYLQTFISACQIMSTFLFFKLTASLYPMWLKTSSLKSPKVVFSSIFKSESSKSNMFLGIRVPNFTLKLKRWMLYFSLVNVHINHFYHFCKDYFLKKTGTTTITFN